MKPYALWTWMYHYALKPQQTSGHSLLLLEPPNVIHVHFWRRCLGNSIQQQKKPCVLSVDWGFLLSRVPCSFVLLRGNTSLISLKLCRCCMCREGCLLIYYYQIVIFKANSLFWIFPIPNISNTLKGKIILNYFTKIEKWLTREISWILTHSVETWYIWYNFLFIFEYALYLFKPQPLHIRRSMSCKIVYIYLFGGFSKSVWPKMSAVSEWVCLK